MNAGEFLFPLGNEAEGPDRRELRRRRASGPATTPSAATAAAPNGIGLFDAPPKVEIDLDHWSLGVWSEIDPFLTFDVAADISEAVPPQAIGPATPTAAEARPPVSSESRTGPQGAVAAGPDASRSAKVNAKRVSRLTWPRKSIDALPKAKWLAYYNHLANEGRRRLGKPFSIKDETFLWDSPRPYLDLKSFRDLIGVQTS